MSRALARLAAARSAVLAQLPRAAGYGVFLRADRRSRPILRLTDTQVKALLAEGAICTDEAGEVFVSSAPQAPRGPPGSKLRRRNASSRSTRSCAIAR